MKPESLRSAFLLAGITVLSVSCKTNGPDQPVPPAPIPPAQYGQPGQPPVPGAPVPPDPAGGRFGYTGANPALGVPAPGAPAPGAPAPAPAPGLRDIRDMKPGGSTTPPVTEQKPTPPPAPASPSPSEMPFGNPVAGNPLAVTLPGVTGEISVEKYDSAGKPTGEPLKRGTQVQIPDPNNPGKKIYFKVP